MNRLQEPGIRPASRIGDLAPYTRDAQVRSGVIALDANEGPPPAGQLLDVIQQVSAEELRRYPGTAALESAIASNLGVPSRRVVVTNGGDDAIDRVCRAVVEPGSSFLTHTPSFEMIERSACLAGGEPVKVRWVDGVFPLDELLERLTPETSLVAIVSPNNPTGQVVPLDMLLQIITRAQECSALVLVDLAYVEFADVDPTPELLAFGNVVVVRTFSKAYSLAGIRVGYAIAPTDVADWLRTVGGPYPVSAISASLAQHSMTQGMPGVRRTIEQVRSERDRLLDVLEELRIETLPTQGNFVLARFAHAQRVRDMLRSLNVTVRSFRDCPSIGDCLRITLPGEESSFEALIRALRTSVIPDTLLFDMDGVLADVSGSYREAIIAAAGEFGGAVTKDEIVRAKLAGNANNDWLLTRQLLAEQGIDVPQDEVTDAFQRAYLGVDGTPGLVATEQLLCNRALLKRLALRATLGIVTGRPRAEALLFLESQGISELFRTVICMEDAPAKPSGAPVQLALSRCRGTRAWMIGDTVDDMESARRSAVVPLGIAAPGEDPEVASLALRGAGAACVLSSLTQLEELLT